MGTSLRIVAHRQNDQGGGFLYCAIALWSALSQNDSMRRRTLSLAVVAAVLCLAARPGPVRPIVCR